MTDQKQLEEASKTENSVDELLDAAGPQTASTLSPPSTPDPSHPLYVATHTFSSKLDGNLNFKKGDQLYIINRDNKNCDCLSENQHSLHYRFWSFDGL